jgi:hypothetical protein
VAVGLGLGVGVTVGVAVGVEVLVAVAVGVGVGANGPVWQALSRKTRAMRSNLRNMEILLSRRVLYPEFRRREGGKGEERLFES